MLYLCKLLEGEIYMKKFLLTMFVLAYASLSAFAVDYVEETQSVYYNPANSSWSAVQQTDDDIRLINKSFIGSGGFQEYYYADGKLAIGPEVNVVFLNNGEFIGINSHDMKFFRYVYNNGKFTSILLTKDDVQKLYPDAEIVEISEFKNNSITLEKKFFETKSFIILNDTNESFYKYSYKPQSVNPSYIKPFLKISHQRKITFSHYGEDTKISPMLKIYVKNKL